MPAIGNWREPRGEYPAVKLSLEPQVRDEYAAVDAYYVRDLPRPLILLHAQGTTGSEIKSLNHDDQRDLYKRPLALGGSLIALDWDNRCPTLANWRALLFALPPTRTREFMRPHEWVKQAVITGELGPVGRLRRGWALNAGKLALLREYMERRWQMKQLEGDLLARSRGGGTVRYADG
jgi:hypothetical protein